jgi:Tfp pilus tip-associated adhesin PilY1
VIDKHDGTSADKNDLVDETYEPITQVGPDDRGWYIDLIQQGGERVVDPDALVAGIVYFTSFAPSTQPCSAGGHSWLYKVDFRNGSGDDGDDDDSNDTTDGRVEDLGDGVATKPVVDVVNEEVIVQGSDTRIHVRDADGEIQWVTVRSWRQRYN